MGRSRSRSRSRERRREKRPADDFAVARDYDREFADRRGEIDYRGSRASRDNDYRERERDDYREKDRGRDRDKERDFRDPRAVRSVEQPSRDRDDRRKGRRGPTVDEFGRVVDHEREKSISPDRPRKFDPRKLRRSESPEPEVEAVKEPKLKNEHLFQITSDDDPETAAAKMEMEAMAKMGLPVQLDTTKGKGNVQTDKFAQTGAVRIKPQRHARQYMNRRCGFNKPLPAEPTRKVHGIGTKEMGVNNVSW